jgi:hypothetical protein
VPKLAPQDPKDRAAVWERFRASVSVLFSHKSGELADRWAKAVVSDREAKTAMAQAEVEKVLAEVRRQRAEARQAEVRARRDAAEAETVVERERLKRKALSYFDMTLCSPEELAEKLRALATQFELNGGRVEIPPPDQDPALPDESMPSP